MRQLSFYILLVLLACSCQSNNKSKEWNNIKVFKDSIPESVKIKIDSVINSSEDFISINKQIDSVSGHKSGASYKVYYNLYGTHTYSAFIAKDTSAGFWWVRLDIDSATLKILRVDIN